MKSWRDALGFGRGWFGGGRRERAPLAGRLALCAGWGALRLFELAVSQRHERALESHGQGRASDDAYGLLVAAHATPFVMAPVEIAIAPRRRSLHPLALAALAAAAATRFWAMRTLAQRWNVRVHGGPDMAVATEGPYRFVRHPNYTAAAVELAALPIALGAPVTALVGSALNALALSRRLRVEEAVLSQSQTWRERMAHKPRFLPRLRPTIEVIHHPQEKPARGRN